jgi:molecular chaperone DnaK
MKDAFGIDFGTTNCVLARAVGTDVETIPLDEPDYHWQDEGFDKVLPSVIAIRDGVPVFGWRAKRHGSGRLDAVKRLLATDDTVRIGDREFLVEEAAATFFRHIQQKVNASGVLSRLDQAVVTIPANSRGLARYRTRLAAGLAGIQVPTLINEPTAAAMAHARTIGQDQRILVFDWGGGTLDVTVLESFEGSFIEQASKGVQRLGGIDVDTAFLAAVMRDLPRANDWNEAQRHEFRLNLELAKVRLSTHEETRVALPTGRGGGPPSESAWPVVTRAMFEDAIRPLVERCREPVEVCLKESPGTIDHLVMVGGSSKIPIIQRFLTELVGVPASTAVDPMTAIAEGAAIAAGIMNGSITDLDFHVGTEHALGTIVVDDDGAPEFSVLIRRNTKYPALATDSYVPASDYQEVVSVKVVEGDPSKPIGHEDNVVLKDWQVNLPEKRTRAEAAFDITYRYDQDGILHVLMRDQQTGSVLMDQELAVGAAQDRSALPRMRRTVDDLMSAGVASDTGSAAVHTPPAPLLSAAVQAAIGKATTRVMPFVPDADRQRLEDLVEAVTSAPPGDEEAHLAELERELRNHAYLL